MKNWEAYQADIELFNVVDFAYNKDTHEIMECTSSNCVHCLFPKKCNVEKTKWLYQDYKKEVNLTTNEKVLCQLMGPGWLYRGNDIDGSVYWSSIKPVKQDGYWFSPMIVNLTRAFPTCKFEDIDIDDIEPWEVRV